jgi:hypothetical protein
MDYLHRFNPDRVELFLSFVNHIDILNTLTEDEIRIIFTEFDSFLFSLIDRLGISELIILIYLQNISRIKLSDGFQENEIFILLENFERDELDIILKKIEQNIIIKLINNFKINEFKLLFEYSRLKNNFNLLVFFSDESNHEQKNRIFRLQSNRLTQFFDLNDEDKNFLISNYNIKEINLILKKYSDQIVQLKKLKKNNRMRILRFKDSKYILNRFETNEIDSLLEIFSELELEELNSRKDKDRIEFINQKYSTLILT